MSDVFLSYHRSTAAQAQDVAMALRGLGYEVWVDDQLPAHRAYSDVIEERLAAAKAVVVIWSAEATRSEWVRSEANAGREAHKLVQLSVDGAKLPMPFDQIQCADLTDWHGDPTDPGWRKVANSVADLIGTAAAGTPVIACALLPLPSKPSIAVMPFANLSGDPEQEYFADGMVAEIITGLSRIKWLFVISRNSTFIYKGRPIDVKTVRRELGVRYVLEGSVRRSGNHVRVTGQLIETETASHVWADRYEATMGDIFKLQDEMTMSIIGAVEPNLRKAEVERARRKRPDNLNAYDLFLRALPFAITAMPENAAKALFFLEEALRLEPDYAVVHGFVAWCHEQRYLRGGLHPETREAARRHAHAAIEAGGDDAMALAMGGFVIGVLERNYETALEAIDRSLALSPSSALAFGFSSIIRVLLGDDTTAMEHATIGIRLSPYDPLIYLPYIGLAYANFFTGNFVEAASAASRASAANPRFSVPCYLHTSALVGLGRLGEAKAMATVLLELQPGFTVSGLVSGNITTPERMGMLADALRQAGLPE